MVEQFRHLFSPLKIGPMTVANRIFIPGHYPRFIPLNGVPTERAINYYSARAEGGVGLIISSVHHVLRMSSAGGPCAIQYDWAIPHFAKMADAIHRYGTKLIAQLGHAGRRANVRAYGGAAWAPSPVARRSIVPPASGIPHEMDIDEIEEVVVAFGSAARRMQQAGLDGVEIQAIYGFLISQFNSPISNQRTDEYGGNLDNRLRFVLEVIDSVRGTVGPDFVVGIRISGDEFLDGGLTFDDIKAIAPKLEATGKLDYLSICTGVPEVVHYPSMYFPLASFVYLAAGVKEVVDLPVFTAGRINDPVLAESILAQGQADMIGMARALIADPELPKKAREGRLDEIRHCIGCNEGCVGIPFLTAPLTCAINPEAGKEKELAIEPATTRKKVMVIGGGAAGLEIARVAALRGHHVSLYEKENELGGQLNIAARAPGRVEFAEVPRYYTYQMKLLKVDVHLGTLVTAEMIGKENPDAVVVATGSQPLIPLLPGANGANVVEVREVLEERVEIGQNVVLIADEHHSKGLSTAEFLADRGKKVEVLTDALHAGAQLDRSTLEAIYPRLLNKGVIITPLTRVKEIQGSTLIVSNVLTNAERRIEGVDTIVISTDGKADNALYRSLKGKLKELYAVGQCLSPRRLLDSIYDGARVGRLL